MTAVVITTTADVPTVGGDEDVWGAENNAKWATARADLLALSTTPANSLKGNNTGAPQGVDDLTTAQVAAMLPAVVGDTGTGGTKGLVPAPAAGDAAGEKYLNADGTWGVPRPFAFAKINGSTGAIVKGVNVTSVSKATGTYDVLLTTAAADADYTIQATARIASASGTATASVDETVAPTTTTFRVRTHTLTTAPAITLADAAFLYVTVWQ